MIYKFGVSFIIFLSNTRHSRLSKFYQAEREKQHLDGAVDFLGIVTTIFRLPYSTSTLMPPFESRRSSNCDGSSSNAH